MRYTSGAGESCQCGSGGGGSSSAAARRAAARRRSAEGLRRVDVAVPAAAAAEEGEGEARARGDEVERLLRRGGGAVPPERLCAAAPGEEEDAPACAGAGARRAREEAAALKGEGECEGGPTALLGDWVTARRRGVGVEVEAAAGARGEARGLAAAEAEGEGEDEGEVDEGKSSGLVGRCAGVVVEVRSAGPAGNVPLVEPSRCGAALGAAPTWSVSQPSPSASGSRSSCVLVGGDDGCARRCSGLALRLLTAAAAGVGMAEGRRRPGCEGERCWRGVDVGGGRGGEVEGGGRTGWERFEWSCWAT